MTPAQGRPASWLPAKARRIRALVRKEFHQMVRDPSTIAMGIILPVILILLFGYGLSLDVKDVKVAVVVENPSPMLSERTSGYRLSPYFNARFMDSLWQAEDLMRRREVDGIVHFASDADRRESGGDTRTHLVVNDTDANRARIILGYDLGVLAMPEQRQASKALPGPGVGQVVVQDRLWFNEANDSHYFLVPGLIVLVMTLIGAFLTSMVMAREWERGTLEALFVTPVRTDEILLGKTIPYFAQGMIGLLLCLLAGKWMFHVPILGSVAVLAVTSMLYLLVALAIGLLISSMTKNQFVASQITLLATFLPAMMLSGFLFDLRSIPAFIRLLTYLLPAKYYVALLQTLFLAGDVWAVIVPNTLVLAVMAIVLLALARLVTRKRLS